MWPKVRGVLVGLLVVAGCVAGVGVASFVAVLMGEHPVVSVLVVGALAATVAAIRKTRDVRARRRVDAWLAGAGWEPSRELRDWPWRRLLPAGAVVELGRVWTGTAEGYPVTTGEIAWDGAAFAGAVRGYRGHGLFVIVRLPTGSDGVALRHPFRLIGATGDLDVPALRSAYHDGIMPPWTVTGDELFTIELVTGRLEPDMIRMSVSRAVTAARMAGRWRLPGDTATAGEVD